MNVNLSLAPLVALLAGILILVMPRLLNYIVAIYLIITGLLGLFGGAIVPLVTGSAADLWGLKLALVVPAACYLTILAFGWFARRPLQSQPR